MTRPVRAGWRRVSKLAAGRLALLAITTALLAVWAPPSPGPGVGHAQQVPLIPLAPGWNLVSLPLASADPSPAAVFASIAGKYNVAFAYDPARASSWLGYDPQVPPALNSLPAIDVRMGFWLNMKEATTLAVAGSTPQRTEITIVPGWNLVGYPAAGARPVAEALASVADKYSAVWAYDPTAANAWQGYDPSIPPFLNSLTELRPGRGYWVAATAAGTLVIGEGAPPGGPSSFDLIDKALADGVINHETALIYTTYAVFADSRLPAQFKGDDSRGPKDSFIVTDVQSQFDTLSPQAKAILGPFLIPPAYKGSWLSPQSAQGSAVAQADGPEPVCNELDPNWKWLDAATAKVRVWWQTRYPEDEDKAKGLAAAMDDTIWPKLTFLMGEPLSDEGYECNGGNGRLDIYLALEGDRSVSPNYWPPGCEKTPAHIQFNRKHSLSELSHEFMHTIQWGYEAKDGCVYDTPVGEYNWLSEATATWAMNYVYPDRNDEHGYASWFLSEPDKPLYTYDGKHEYGAYLFFLFLSELYDSPRFVRGVWNEVDEYDSLQALVLVTPNNLEGDWPRIALCNWNRPPVDCYAQWDRLTEGVPSTPTSVNLGGAASRTFALPADVQPLAASYTHFVFDDDEVRSVVFDNTLVGYPYAAVQALVKIGGQWQGPDYWNWTHEPIKSFCRDVASQRIEELVIVISNSDWSTKTKLNPAQKPTLAASKAGCDGWRGWANATVRDQRPWLGGLKGDVEGCIDSMVDTTETMRAEVTFELVEDLSSEEKLHYYTTGGSVQWDHSGTYCNGRQVGNKYEVFEICTGQASGSFTIGRGADDLLGAGELEVFLDTAPATYSGVGLWPGGHSITYTCLPVDGTASRTFEYDSWASIWFLTPDRDIPPGANLAVGADGVTIEDSFTKTSTQGITREWSWHFEAAVVGP